MPDKRVIINEGGRDKLSEVESHFGTQPKLQSTTGRLADGIISKIIYRVSYIWRNKFLKRSLKKYQDGTTPTNPNA